MSKYPNCDIYRVRISQNRARRWELGRSRLRNTPIAIAILSKFSAKCAHGVGNPSGPDVEVPPIAITTWSKSPPEISHGVGNSCGRHVGISQSRKLLGRILPKNHICRRKLGRSRRRNTPNCDRYSVRIRQNQITSNQLLIFVISFFLLSNQLLFKSMVSVISFFLT